MSTYAYNAVQDGPIDAFFSNGRNNHQPIFLWLELATGCAWVRQYESNALPIQVHEGDWKFWRISGIPTPHEASTLVDGLLPLLQNEIERPGTKEDEIAERCSNFVSEIDFCPAPIFLEYEERWFDANGDECEMYDGVRVVLGKWGTIRHNTSDRKLRAIEKAIAQSAEPETFVIGLRRHLEAIRLDLKQRT